MKTYMVLGAGILGAATAYHLAKAGRKVTVVDRLDRGQATAAAAGIICPWLSQRRNQAWYRLAKNGARYYPTLVKALHADGETETGYEQVGTIRLHHDPVKLDRIEERACQRRQDAPEMGEIKRLTAAETQHLFPVLSSDQFGAVYISGGARVDGKAMRDALLRAAIAHGATVIHGNATLHDQHGRVVGVQIDQDVFAADRLILTTGAWLRDLLLPLGIAFDVVPQKAQIIHTQLSIRDTANWPVVMPPNNQYMLAFPEGRVVIGATHEDHTGFDTRVTVGGVHEILDKALQVAPGLKDATILETRVGFRPFTPGFLPVIGKLESLGEVFIANGLGASGLTVGPYLGSELAKLAMGLELQIEREDYDINTCLKVGKM